MTVTASKRTVYAGDDLIVNLEWKNGTKKEPGNPIDLTGYTFTVFIVKNGSIVVNGTVTTDDINGKIKIAFSEQQTQNLSGSYEVRLRYTDSVGDTLTFFILPIEVKK